MCRSLHKQGQHRRSGACGWGALHPYLHRGAPHRGNLLPTCGLPLRQQPTLLLGCRPVSLLRHHGHLQPTSMAAQQQLQQSRLMQPLSGRQIICVRWRLPHLLDTKSLGRCSRQSSCQQQTCTQWQLTSRAQASLVQCQRTAARERSARRRCALRSRPLSCGKQVMCQSMR